MNNRWRKIEEAQYRYLKPVLYYVDCDEPYYLIPRCDGINRITRKVCRKITYYLSGIDMNACYVFHITEQEAKEIQDNGRIDG